jgi:predicted GNAT family N-acyltransferase
MSSSEHSYRICILAWADAREMTRPLREKVFVHEQGVPIEEEWDEWDAYSQHAIAFAPSGEPIGTGRLLPLESPEKSAGRIGRMAVLKPWRRKGVGRALLDALVSLAAAQGALIILLHAQKHAVAFYRRNGFEVEGEEFMEAGIPHLIMRRSLASRPGESES